MDIYLKLQEMEQFRLQQEIDAQLRDLLARHPEVKQTGIPQPVIERFKQGGVSLREAYLLANPHRGKRQLSRAERQALKAYGLDETALD